MRLVLLDDHHVLREALGLLLGLSGHEVVAETDRVAEARTLVLATRPDALVTDLGLEGDDSLGLIAELSRTMPRLSIVVYTGFEDPAAIRAALVAGAQAVVSKGASREELLAALDAVQDGQAWLDPRLRQVALDAAATAPVLTPRERDVLTLLAAGLSGAQVAEQLVLSTETIRSHVKSAMQRLNANTRTHAVVLALQLAQIELGPPPRA